MSYKRRTGKGGKRPVRHISNLRTSTARVDDSSSPTSSSSPNPSPASTEWGLTAVVIGDASQVYEANVTPDTTFYRWFQIMKYQNWLKLGHISTSSVVAWKLNTPVPVSAGVDELPKLWDNFSGKCKEMDCMARIGKKFPQPPTSGFIHVILEVEEREPLRPPTQTKADYDMEVQAAVAHLREIEERPRSPLLPTFTLPSFLIRLDRPIAGPIPFSYPDEDSNDSS